MTIAFTSKPRGNLKTIPKKQKIKTIENWEAGSFGWKKL